MSEEERERLEELKREAIRACSILGGVAEEKSEFGVESRHEMIDCPLNISGQDLKIRWRWAYIEGIPPEQIPKPEEPNRGDVILDIEPVGAVFLDNVERIEISPSGVVTYKKGMDWISINPKGWHAHLE